MTRDQVNRMLRTMEHVREMSYEADTKAEEKRLCREYARMHKAIEPYITGKKQYSDEMEGATNGK